MKYTYGETQRWRLGLKNRPGFKPTRIPKERRPGRVTITTFIKPKTK